MSIDDVEIKMKGTRAEGEPMAGDENSEKDEIAIVLDRTRAEFGKLIHVACRAVLLEPTLNTVITLSVQLNFLAGDFDEKRKLTTGLKRQFTVIERQLEQLKETFKFMLGQRWDVTKRLVQEPRYSQIEQERAGLKSLSLYGLQEVFTERKRLVHDANNMLAVIMSTLSLAKVNIERGNMEKGSKYLNENFEVPLGRMIELLNSGVNKAPAVPMNMVGLRQKADGLAAELPGDLELTVDDQIIDGVEADLGISETHFGQLLFNLVNNAYQAGARKVKLVLRVQAGKAIVLIQDDGPGFGGKLPLEASAESNLVNAKGDGTRGNGLVFCIDFCQKAGGDLKLLSTRRDDGRQIGAEFEASFPLKQKADPR